MKVELDIRLLLGVLSLSIGLALFALTHNQIVHFVGGLLVGMGVGGLLISRKTPGSTAE